jgi:hypothetical protein
MLYQFVIDRGDATYDSKTKMEEEEEEKKMKARQSGVYLNLIPNVARGVSNWASVIHRPPLHVA